ncbi:EAL domain-containing protein [Salinarimonas sp.]|uniref:EAL domain-containing protein n=1 Tax=Salinarimonas sp. TaxID=2766526 RepID=UPI00391D74B5
MRAFSTALAQCLLVLALLVAIGTALLGVAGPAHAVDAVRVHRDATAVDLTPAIERYRSDGDVIQISTAPGADGIVRRIAVRAREAGSRPDWVVFALTNDSDEQIDRYLVAPHFRLAGSGVMWPDLGSSRIAAVTASQGFRPDRVEDPRADVFLMTLDPGTTVTFVAELRTPEVPRVYLFEPTVYREKENGLTLYKGIIIGISGLLALFLTVIFVVKGALIFPAAAALAWAVLAYACIDFGFFARVFPLAEDIERVYRAAAEAVLAATLLVFLFAYLNLNRWHVRYAHVTLVWLAFLAGLVGLAVVDPPVAAGVARISLATVAGIGFLLVLHLATHGYDRAVMLIPTWLLLVVWVAAAGFTVMGHLQSDLVAPALIGGLVLIVMLIGFTVVQHAFSGVSLAHGSVSDTERRALALAGAGDIVFDWDVVSDRVYVSPEVETLLGLKRGALGGPASGWLDLIHPFDRDRYGAALDSVIESQRGRIAIDVRLRGESGAFHWLRLKARPVVGTDGEVIRVIGTLSDVTDSKTSEERLLHDAVHDSLTGLPNRQLFEDRIETALAFAAQDGALRPAVILVDVDRFRATNEAVGMAGGDAILLTLARRLGRLLRPQDTLARLSSDCFGLVLLSEREAERVMAFAEMIRRALSTPVTHAERELFLTASIGVALHDQTADQRREDVIKKAEIAMAHAQRQGGNRVEVFKLTMQSVRDDRLALAADLRRALERGEMKVAFEPVVRLEDRTVAGFQASLRWDHPRLGRVRPETFVPLAEEAGLVVELGAFALQRAASELSVWQAALDVDPPIFASVSLPSRQLLRPDLVGELKTVLARASVLPGSLKLELPEGLVMHNPEFATQLLLRLRDLGAGLVLDDFGTGFSSLSYLQRFPFDHVKIDQSFVRALSNGGRAGALRPMVALARELGLGIVAEGVETEEAANALADLGCDYAVGWLFGEPMTSHQARRVVGAATEAA